MRKMRHWETPTSVSSCEVCFFTLGLVVGANEGETWDSGKVNSQWLLVKSSLYRKALSLAFNSICSVLIS